MYAVRFTIQELIINKLLKGVLKVYFNFNVPLYLKRINSNKAYLREDDLQNYNPCNLHNVNSRSKLHEIGGGLYKT